MSHFFPVFVYRYLILEYIFFQGNKEKPSMKKKNRSRAKSHRTLWNLKQNKFVKKICKRQGNLKVLWTQHGIIDALVNNKFRKTITGLNYSVFWCFLERQQSCQTYSFLEKNWLFLANSLKEKNRDILNWQGKKYSSFCN